MRKPKRRKSSSGSSASESLKELFAALGKKDGTDDAEMENALYKNALAGDTAAQMFWLKNRMPDKWKDKPTTNDHDIDIQAAREILISVRRIATDEYEAGAVPETD